MKYVKQEKSRYPKIRHLREDNDITQEEVANYLNMSQTGYSKYETGINQPSIQTLVKLATLYKVSVDYLIGYSNLKKHK